MSKAGGTDGQSGNPFKMITVGLVVVVVVMALVFTTREMEREVSDQDRMVAAESEVAAVGLFLGEGDVPNAVIALHDVGLRLGRVAGAEDAARDVSEAVLAEIHAHAATKDRLREAGNEIAALKEQLAEANRRIDFQTERNRDLEAVRDRNALVLTNVAEGRTALARRLLDATGEKDVVATATEGLVARIEDLSRAAAATGAERAHRLRALARTWPVEGVQAFATLAGNEEDRRVRARTAISAAETAVDRKDSKAAGDSLVEALSAAGVPEIRGLSGQLFELELREGAARAEKEGRPIEAAAAWRVAGETEKAGRLEMGLLRAAVCQELEVQANELMYRMDWFGAAGVFDAAHRQSQKAEYAKEMETCRARGWLGLADEFQNRGLMNAAGMMAVRAVNHDHALAEPVADTLFARIEEEKLSATFRDAATAVADGNAARAAEMIKDLDAPPELRARIEKAAREQAVSRARIALHAGDGPTALELLEAAGADGPLVAEARLLAGDVTKGVAGLPGTAEEKTLVLLSSGWNVLSEDPARAARLGLAAVDATGIRPGSIALLSAALSKAGNPPKGDELWDTVRATIFAAEAGGSGVR